MYVCVCVCVWCMCVCGVCVCVWCVCVCGVCVWCVCVCGVCVCVRAPQRTLHEVILHLCHLHTDRDTSTTPPLMCIHPTALHHAQCYTANTHLIPLTARTYTPLVDEGNSTASMTLSVGAGSSCLAKEQTDKKDCIRTVQHTVTVPG